MSVVVDFCFSGVELRQQVHWRDSVGSGLPQRGGIKDYAPNESLLQEQKLQSFYEERNEVLREERVQKQ